MKDFISKNIDAWTIKGFIMIDENIIVGSLWGFAYKMYLDEKNGQKK